MKIKSLLLLLAFVIVVPLSSSAQENLNLDQVLEKYYQAIGGLEKWQNLNTMTMKGTMSSSGKVMPLTAYYERPNKCRVEFTLEDTVMAQVYGGYFAWQLNPLSGNPDPAPMSSGRTRYLQDTCGIESSLIDYKKKRYRVKLLGVEKIKGQEAYKISVRYPSKNLETYYIDTKNFLVIRSVGLYNMDGTEIRTTTTFKDYKDTDGYLVPYNLVIQIHGSPAEELLKIDKFAFNPQIDTKIFDFPRDKIMKLESKEDLQKKQQQMQQNMQKQQKQ